MSFTFFFFGHQVFIYPTSPKNFQIIEAIELLEEGRQRLKDYVEDLVSLSEQHFPEVLKDLPPQKLPKTTNTSGLEALTHTEVRKRSLLFLLVRSFSETESF